MITDEMLPMRVKDEEEQCVSSDRHSHRIKVKFRSEARIYNIHCGQPQTLLEAIKSRLLPEFNVKIGCANQNIIIKRGEGANSSLVATHFPCSCLDDGECLTIRASSKFIEAPYQEKYPVQEKEAYVYFNVDKEGGKNYESKRKQIFRYTDITEKFKYFCVYGLKEMTVEQALNQDGRFVDNLTGFYLSNNSESNDTTKCTEIVELVDGGHYMICFPKKRRSKKNNPKQETSNQQQMQQSNQQVDPQRRPVEDSQCTSGTGRVLEVAREKNISLKMAAEQTGTTIDHKEIRDLLHQQFPKLKEVMENRFPGQSFEKALNLHKENFGKIENAFSEVGTVMELLKLGTAVCLLKIHDITSSLTVQGTGFVLFDNFVLTNAHLFNEWAKNGIEKWREYIKITAKFNYNKSDTESESRPNFEAKLLGDNLDLDFAILELITNKQNTDQATETEDDKVPPGLLKKFAPLPYDGYACLLGHSAGGAKKMDPTCIIRKEKRDQAVEQNLESHKDHIFTIYAIKQGISSDPKADMFVTYNTFMYHGSSGSPVFDAYGQVFGLHTGGFFFGNPKPNESVIEFAFPLLAIYEKFLSALKEKRNLELLNRVQEESKGNKHLEDIMKSVVGPWENWHETVNLESESSESMEIS